MKFCFTLLMIVSLASGSMAQTLVGKRIADLNPALYPISGQAVLQAFDDGTLTLGLTDDFDTPWGPDVRILLANALDLNGAVEIVNLTSINHFEGAIDFDVPDNIQIEDFQFVLFYCVQFQQFWASGELGETVNPGGFVCEMSTVTNNDGGSIVELCTDDGNPDVVNFSNNLDAIIGTNYAYLLTDENQILQAVISTNTYDFEGGTTANQRIYGIHYDGQLMPAIGMNRLMTAATGCFTHSDEMAYLGVIGTACTPAFECKESVTATTGWVTQADICSTDGQADIVELRNNIGAAPGDHYAFLITDDNEVLQEVVLDTSYNFEGTGTEVQRVYGLSYDGELNPVIGADRKQTTASICAIHSGDDLFLKIEKTTACVTSTREADWAAQLLIYPNPTTDLLTIELPTDFAATQLQVFDLRGVEMVRFSPAATGTLQLNLGRYVDGIYVLQIVGEQAVLNRTIQLKH